MGKKGHAWVNARCGRLRDMERTRLGDHIGSCGMGEKVGDATLVERVDTLE